MKIALSTLLFILITTSISLIFYWDEGPGLVTPPRFVSLATGQHLIRFGVGYHLL